MGLRADSQLENMPVVLFVQRGSAQAAAAAVCSCWICVRDREEEVQHRPRHQVSTDQCQTAALGADNLIN